MIIAPVVELTLVGVADAGVPNEERIGLRPTEPVNLAQFGLMVGLSHPNGAVTPLRDNFFWFGELIIEPPSWVVVYTGRGQYQESVLRDSGHKLYALYWGRPSTMFDWPNIVPVLFRADAVLIGSRVISGGRKRISAPT